MTREDRTRPGEFELIERLFAPLAANAPGSLQLKDDAALVSGRSGEDLVVTVDTLVAGRHFLPDDPPDLVAKKLLRVNLSDLAAKGARPDFYLLSLALPKDVSFAWLEAFSRGLADDQKMFGITLVGGDTTATDGPLVLTVTAMGGVAAGGMVRRNGAKPGDRVWVTGTIGDAAIGLAALANGMSGLADEQVRTLVERYRLPQPRCAFGLALSGVAHAAADVSDGLAADLGHILEASGAGAVLELGRLPLSSAARAALDLGRTSLEHLVSDGDDYEIVLAAPASAAGALTRAAGAIGLTEVGHIVAEPGLTILGPDGRAVALEKKGFQHF